MTAFSQLCQTVRRRWTETTTHQMCIEASGGARSDKRQSRQNAQRGFQSCQVGHTTTRGLDANTSKRDTPSLCDIVLPPLCLTWTSGLPKPPASAPPAHPATMFGNYLGMLEAGNGRSVSWLMLIDIINRRSWSQRPTSRREAHQGSCTSSSLYESLDFRT